MTITALQQTISDLDAIGIAVWLHIEKDHVRILMQNKDSKLAKRHIAWSEVDKLPLAISELAEHLH